ncbi:MAG: endonuclease/exonuclease/phosphatase family protein [Massilia sp.]|jgi:endonuclease/exonuclease/phosphatase family metal-dependent hydrolase|uniref:endonuclease/exonuclease/phosphatase family protein n=1 Tax=Massilia sp. TaxID=1882437 RepID=UPI0019B9F6BE|nr:endonuclease/exonuclease/phosphatase family protein [Oxalobacteraceae sp. CFBP 8761]MBD8625732.1 endonuclease/exonuclease/phosphatase family protein [Oxalobacteraceae sp. CFBP 8753]MBD8630182.1 endonuclease/exonuclease/phosphatase family protein [Oxalobacteraceae sp. CFBP 8755]MBD8724459.1 endonuclease/exonuclease/phosphatase family protein [Oxalobacteraceae sp. CFBP 13708]
MQEELRFATFNTFNLAPPGARLYDNLAPTTADEYEAKLDWTAHQLDLINADVIGFQEIFSQSVLAEVLQRTRRYRDAHHIGFDPDPGAVRLTPSVALVSRLPLAEPGTELGKFPANVTMPPGSRDPDRFTRAPLHAGVIAPSGVVIDVIVVHLKSRRPDYRSSDSGADPHLYALACLRSLIRRGTEATALRVLLTDMAHTHRRPRIVLGDFNDVADSVTTEIVLGAGTPQAERLYDASQVQRRLDHQRHVGFSILHDTRHSTIDHILVSPEFNPALPEAIGEVIDVVYLNDHLNLALPESSDHGQVLARIRLFD